MDKQNKPTGSKKKTRRGIKAYWIENSACIIVNGDTLVKKKIYNCLQAKTV